MVVLVQLYLPLVPAMVLLGLLVSAMVHLWSAFATVQQSAMVQKYSEPNFQLEAAHLPDSESAAVRTLTSLG
jgi:hypothetical protein